MNTEALNNVLEEIVELTQQIELDESNYKYALELQIDPYSLIQCKEEILEMKKRLEALKIQSK